MAEGGGGDGELHLFLPAQVTSNSSPFNKILIGCYMLHLSAFEKEQTVSSIYAPLSPPQGESTNSHARHQPVKHAAPPEPLTPFTSGNRQRRQPLPNNPSPALVSLTAVSDAIKATAKAPVVDGGSSSRFRQRLLWVAAQACTDTRGLGSAPRCVEAHPKHEKYRNHVEEPGEREWRKTSLLWRASERLFQNCWAVTTLEFNTSAATEAH